MRTVSLAFSLSLAAAAAAQTQFRAESVDVRAAVTDAELIDIDGDGDLDLVQARTDTVFLLTNDGSGRFATAVAVAGPIASAQLAAGDFDGDGFGDVVVISRFLSASVWLRGGASGAVAVPLGLPTTPVLEYRPLSVDVDGDGDLDVVVGATQGETTLLRNDGAGGLDVDPSGFSGFSLSFGATADAGDVDGDGDLDVYLSGPLTAALLINDGTGRFSPRSSPASGIVTSVAMGDFTGDGLADVFLARSQASGLLLESTGQGTFVVANSVAGAGWYGTTPVDVDEDGDLDLIGGAGNSLSGSFNVAINVGGGQFVDATQTRVQPVLEFLTRVAVGDVDGDGDIDAFVAGFPLPIARDQLLYRNHHRQTSVPTQPSPGQDLRVVVSRQPGYATSYGLALPALGPVAGLPLPTPFGAFHIDPGDVLALPFVSLPGPVGEGEVRLAVPANPALSGTRVRVQALLLEPFGSAAPRLTGFAPVVVR